MLLVDKKFVFLTFVSNLFFCPKMFLRDQTLISTIHSTSLVKHLKIVGILQNFEICTKFCSFYNNSIRVSIVNLKTDLGNKDRFFLNLPLWCSFP